MSDINDGRQGTAGLARCVIFKEAAIGHCGTGINVSLIVPK